MYAMNITWHSSGEASRLLKVHYCIMSRALFYGIIKLLYVHVVQRESGVGGHTVLEFLGHLKNGIFRGRIGLGFRVRLKNLKTLGDSKCQKGVGRVSWWLRWLGCVPYGSDVGLGLACGLCCMLSPLSFCL